MALVVSNDMALGDFETAMYQAWGQKNDDGVGIFWRDYPQKENEMPLHLSRVYQTKDMGKIANTYDRMLIHFRYGTGGDGTHPFICNHFKEKFSQNWLMTHNGTIRDDGITEELKKTHAFTTGIDSETFIHLWATMEFTGKSLKDLATEFSKLVKDNKIKGYGNLIFYNIVTDDWIGFCSTDLCVVESQGLVILCSDMDFLDKEKSKANGVKMLELKEGDIVTGHGTTYEVISDIWHMKKEKISNSCGVYQQGVTYYYRQKGKSVFGTDYDNSGADYEGYGTVETKELHEFTPNTLDGKGKCTTCKSQFSMLTIHKPHAYKAKADTKDNNGLCALCDWSQSQGKHSSNPHEFIAGKGKHGGISSKCAICKNTVLNTIHSKSEDSSEAAIRPHEFVPYNTTDPRCSSCGYLRESIFANMKIHLETEITLSNPKSDSDSLPKITNKGQFPYVENCLCDPFGMPNPLICRPHWIEGYRYYDEQNHISKSAIEEPYTMEKHFGRNQVDGIYG